MAPVLHRNILFEEPLLTPDPYDPPEFDTTCYNCVYGCPAYCYQSQYFPTPPTEPVIQSKHEMSTTLIIMLCLLGGAFLFLSYLTYTRYGRSRDRGDSLTRDGLDGFRQDHDDHAADHHVWFIRTVGLSQSVIDSITVFRYKKGERLIEGSDCSVCLVEFGEDEVLRLLPKCSHAFHVDCIDTWLRSHMNCPVCRAPVVPSNSLAGEASLVEMRSEEHGGVENVNEAREIRIVDSSSSGHSDTDKIDEILSRNGYFLDKRISRGIRVLSDLSDRGVKFDQENFQQTRRSVSVDFGYASTIYVKKGKGRSGRSSTMEGLGKEVNVDTSVYRLKKCSSYAHSLQRVPVSMKRSFSCSAKRSQRKHTRTLESLLALD